jgi:hypothetical protein
MNNNLKTSCGTFIALGWSDLETVPIKHQLKLPAIECYD